MKKVILAAIVPVFALSSLLTAPVALAEGLVGGVGISRIATDQGGYDVTLNALQGSVGYQFGADGVSLTPEFRFGTGVKDDTALGVNVDLRNYYGVDVRAALEGDRAYAFVAPSYTHYRIAASTPGVAVASNAWDFGIGVGAGYRFTDNLSAEVTYERVNDAGVVGLGLRVAF